MDKDDFRYYFIRIDTFSDYTYMANAENVRDLYLISPLEQELPILKW